MCRGWFTGLPANMPPLLATAGEHLFRSISPPTPLPSQQALRLAASTINTLPATTSTRSERPWSCRAAGSSRLLRTTPHPRVYMAQRQSRYANANLPFTCHPQQRAEHQQSLTSLLITASLSSQAPAPSLYKAIYGYMNDLSWPAKLC